MGCNVFNSNSAPEEKKISCLPQNATSGCKNNHSTYYSTGMKKLPALK